MAEEWKNKLYFGDNLDVMRKHIPDESVDLIYLDPPFNSNATYNVLFQEKNGTVPAVQVKAFEDFWHWDAGAERTYHEVVTQGPKKLADLLRALMEFLGRNDMMAYLTMMAARLVEIHRVLKPTGSVYLHCDPTASHYLKLLLDAVFGHKNFRNEIIWKRSTTHSDAKRFARVSDSIFFYSKSERMVWNRPRGQYNEEYVQSHYVYVDKDGRRFRYDNLVKPKGSRGYFYILLGCPPPPNGWRMPEERAKQWLAEGRIEIPPKGKIPAYKRYLDEMRGPLLTNIWTDIPPINSQAKEALNYPTQKPEALLERIIKASSNEGDLVLDPFCGCGTTIAVAERLKRRWIGIDITHLAIALIKHRLEDAFGKDLAPYEVIGVPQDLKSAEALAQQDRFQFQYWALSLVDARPVGEKKKKGPDEGIDGYVYFFDDASGIPKKAIVSVKSGNVTVSQIRDLKGVLEREGAAIGTFITLREPTEPMRREALAAGFYEPEIYGGERKFPRIQILTIRELLEGRQIEMPRLAPPDTFKKAPRREKAKAEQIRME